MRGPPQRIEHHGDELLLLAARLVQERLVAPVEPPVCVPKIGQLSRRLGGIDHIDKLTALLWRDLSGWRKLEDVTDEPVPICHADCGRRRLVMPGDDVRPHAQTPELVDTGHPRAVRPVTENGHRHTDQVPQPLGLGPGQRGRRRPGVVPGVAYPHHVGERAEVLGSG